VWKQKQAKISIVRGDAGKPDVKNFRGVQGRMPDFWKVLKSATGKTPE
jgi:hypothetical protein